MNNPHLAEDYRKRARGRKVAIDALFAAGHFADVVRECQEACELALKSLIRQAGHKVPHTHEVSEALRTAIAADFPGPAAAKLERLCAISKSQRRDRELSFYGSEDITPSSFYVEADARKAMDELDEVLAVLPA